MANIASLKVTSEAFEEGESIPAKYTCEGESVSPPLRVDNMPEGTQTVAIIMEDPDAPGGIFDHWLIWNIPPDILIDENRRLGMSGKNSARKTGYHAPCPPTGSHRYFFHVFALDGALNINSGAGRETLEKAMEAHILAKGSLMGRYQRSGNNQLIV
jgi:Raf kinase inhibitor-like YbhB/YbcL family protein